MLVIRFIQGLGWGMANTASPTLASDIIPQKRFAEGMSWFTQGNAIASVLTVKKLHRRIVGAFTMS